MTRKLEQLLDLPSAQEAELVAPQPTAERSPSVVNLQNQLEEFDKISGALPKVEGLGTMSDTELDGLAKKAEDAFDDLMDLGMNVEARYSSRIFEVAGGMLKNAIDAKSAKIDKKLKMIEQQLKKQALDQKGNNADESITVQGEGVIVSDRNSLIEKLKQMNK
jgi:uncharacterized protein YacL (UPF0231 family)